MRTKGDNGFVAMADKMMELARSQAGFLGVKSASEQLNYCFILLNTWNQYNSGAHKIFEESA